MGGSQVILPPAAVRPVRGWRDLRSLGRLAGPEMNGKGKWGLREQRHGVSESIDGSTHTTCSPSFAALAVLLATQAKWDDECSARAEPKRSTTRRSARRDRAAETQAQI